MSEENISDAEFEEIIDDGTELNKESPADSQHPLSNAELVQAIATAVKSGDLGSKQAKQIRADIGIFQSSFTRKHETKSKRKTKRQLQKDARKKQRKTKR